MGIESLALLVVAVFIGMFGVFCVAIAYETEFWDSIIGFNIHSVSLALATTSLYSACVLGIAGFIVVVIKEIL